MDVRTGFLFGDYCYNLLEVCAGLSDPELRAWAERAVVDERFYALLLAEGDPLLAAAEPPNPLDVLGEDTEEILCQALASLYARRVELPVAFAPDLPDIGQPGPRVRPSALAERFRLERE